jgi:hypothetical protein
LIPNNLSYPIDLVFSIVRVPSAEPRALSHIQFDITSGTLAGNLTWAGWKFFSQPTLNFSSQPTLSTTTMTADAGMFTSYDGPGGYMLSNMRWTYTTFENHPGERLLVHLLPRNDTDNTSPVEHNEISFVLRGCKILPGLLNSWQVTFVEHCEDGATPGGWVRYRLAPWEDA